MPGPSDTRADTRETFWIAIVGVVAVIIALLIIVLVFKDNKDPATVITAVLGPVTGLVGTIVGVVAGQRVGAAGADRAQRRADTLQAQIAVVGRDHPDALTQAIAKYPELFNVPPRPP